MPKAVSARARARGWDASASLAEVQKVLGGVPSARPAKIYSIVEKKGVPQNFTVMSCGPRSATPSRRKSKTSRAFRAAKPPSRLRSICISAARAARKSVSVLMDGVWPFQITRPRAPRLRCLPRLPNERLKVLKASYRHRTFAKKSANFAHLLIRVFVFLGHRFWRFRLVSSHFGSYVGMAIANIISHIPVIPAIHAL